MYVINATNVNDAYYRCLMRFKQEIKSKEVIEITTRGSRRYKLPAPLSTIYEYPRERVLFDQIRDANPFFHFMEALWVLAGRKDVKWLAQWLGKISEFSDDGETFYGAYGERIFRAEQVQKAVKRLREDPDSSRAVISIYDRWDVEYNGKDLPCNCTIFLGIDRGRLNLTVANRSNDMIWGAYGANVVQFSTIQEYIAFQLGVQMGWYCQISNNAHVYPDHDVTKRALDKIEPARDYYNPYYTTPVIKPFDMFTGCEDHAAWDVQLRHFMNENWPSISYPYFTDVARPILEVHRLYKADKLSDAISSCNAIAAEDWRMACKEWLQRRVAKRAKA